METGIVSSSKAPSLSPQLIDTAKTDLQEVWYNAKSATISDNSGTLGSFYMSIKSVATDNEGAQNIGLSKWRSSGSEIDVRSSVFIDEFRTKSLAKSVLVDGRDLDEVQLLLEKMRRNVVYDIEVENISVDYEKVILKIEATELGFLIIVFFSSMIALSVTFKVQLIHPSIGIAMVIGGAFYMLMGYAIRKGWTP